MRERPKAADRGKEILAALASHIPDAGVDEGVDEGDETGHPTF